MIAVIRNYTRNLFQFLEFVKDDATGKADLTFDLDVISSCSFFCYFEKSYFWKVLDLRQKNYVFPGVQYHFSSKTNILKDILPFR